MEENAKQTMEERLSRINAKLANVMEHMGSVKKISQIGY